MDSNGSHTSSGGEASGPTGPINGVSRLHALDWSYLKIVLAILLLLADL